MGASSSVQERPAVAVPSNKSGRVGKLQHNNYLSGPWSFLVKEHVQCVCEGGGRCYREDPSKQKLPNAIPGLHSSWVAKQVLAMSRPWASHVTSHNLVAAFQRENIGMILNLQEVGEHSGCGPGNLPHTGFSYDPEMFMAGGIGYYNFSWRDMGVPHLGLMMDIVQVMHHVMHVEGRKIAVHCHAGLGRTGLAIACYFVFAGLCSAAEAVAAVRRDRPGAVQTRTQESFVHVFGQYLGHLRCVLPVSPQAAAGHQAAHLKSNTQPPWTADLKMLPSLASQAYAPQPTMDYPQALSRQQRLLHGVERRSFKHLHKFVKEVVFILIAAAKEHPRPAAPHPSTDPPTNTYSTPAPPLQPQTDSSNKIHPWGPQAHHHSNGQGLASHTISAAAGPSAVGTFAWALATSIGAISGSPVDLARCRLLSSHPACQKFWPASQPGSSSPEVLISRVAGLVNAHEYRHLPSAPLLPLMAALTTFFSQLQDPALSLTACGQIAAVYAALPFETTAEPAEQQFSAAFQVLQPLPPPDAELLLLLTALLRTTAAVSAPGCEADLLTSGRWVVLLLLGPDLAGTPSAEQAVLSFLWFLLRNDVAYAALILLKQQRTAGCLNPLSSRSDCRPGAVKGLFGGASPLSIPAVAAAASGSSPLGKVLAVRLAAAASTAAAATATKPDRLSPAHLLVDGSNDSPQSPSSLANSHSGLSRRLSAGLPPARALGVAGLLPSMPQSPQIPSNEQFQNILATGIAGLYGPSAGSGRGAQWSGVPTVMLPLPYQGPGSIEIHDVWR